LISSLTSRRELARAARLTSSRSAGNAAGAG
jgi:hypothetical protein